VPALHWVDRHFPEKWISDYLYKTANRNVVELGGVRRKYWWIIRCLAKSRGKSSKRRGLLKPEAGGWRRPLYQ
jgi:hypothetical protein